MITPGSSVRPCRLARTRMLRFASHNLELGSCIQVYDHLDRCLRSRETRSRLTDIASCDSAIAGSTINKAAIVRVAINSRFLPRME